MIAISLVRLTSSITTTKLNQLENYHYHKLNQEDYYLSLVGQLKSIEAAELFLLYNTLDDGYKKAVTHFRSEFPMLIDDKDKYIDNFANLDEAVKQYLINYNTNDIPNEKIIYNELSKLTVITDSYIKTLATREQWLKESDYRYTTVVVNVLNAHGLTTHRKLLQQAMEVHNQYFLYQSRMINVVRYLEGSRLTMLEIIDRINKISPPLNEYINKLTQKK